MFSSPELGSQLVEFLGPLNCFKNLLISVVLPPDRRADCLQWFISPVATLSAVSWIPSVDDPVYFKGLTFLLTVFQPNIRAALSNRSFILLREGVP